MSLSIAFSLGLVSLILLVFVYRVFKQISSDLDRRIKEETYLSKINKDVQEGDIQVTHNEIVKILGEFEEMKSKYSQQQIYYQSLLLTLMELKLNQQFDRKKQVLSDDFVTAYMNLSNYKKISVLNPFGSLSIFSQSDKDKNILKQLEFYFDTQKQASRVNNSYSIMHDTVKENTLRNWSNRTSIDNQMHYN